MDPKELNEVRRLLTHLEVAVEVMAFVGVLALIAALACR